MKSQNWKKNVYFKCDILEDNLSLKDLPLSGNLLHCWALRIAQDQLDLEEVGGSKEGEKQ